MLQSIKTSRRKPGKLERQNIGYLFIAPSLLLYAVFVFIPIFWTIGLSFTDYNLKTSTFVGFANYQNLFKDAVFLKAFWNTINYTLLALVPTMALGLALAMLINKRFRGRAFFRALFYMPNIISIVASSLAWMYLYSEVGILNMGLRAIGLGRVQWLNNPSISLACVVVVSLWGSGGYNMLLFLSGLQSIPTHLYEAASIDGANGWQQFLKITIPQLAPTTFFVFVMTCIQSFQVFGQVYMMTGGGPDNATTTLAHQIYTNAFQYYKMGYASAMAVALLCVIMLITGINFRFGNTDGGE
jgi:ABC-type sugar transport systems, permease components